MSEAMRKTAKLAKGVVTGRTECRHCDTTVVSHNPAKILVGLGDHVRQEHRDIVEGDK